MELQENELLFIVDYSFPETLLYLLTKDSDKSLDFDKDHMTLSLI